MRRQVVAVVALATLGACSASSGVATIEAYEIGWVDPDDEGVQQRLALDGAPCIDPGGRVDRDLSVRVDDWRKVVDCDQPHRLQIIGTVPAPDHVTDPAPLFDENSREYREIRDDVALDCQQHVERLIGLETVAWDGMLDDAMVFHPADDGPSYDFFTPVPGAMWEDGHHELLCYVKFTPAVDYSLAEFTAPGGGAPADGRSCFDPEWYVTCDEEHVAEMFIDIDVTGLVERGEIADDFTSLYETIKDPEGDLAFLDSMCWFAADELEVLLDPELYAFAWIDEVDYPTLSGRYDVHCIAQLADEADSVVGSVFD